MLGALGGVTAAAIVVSAIRGKLMPSVLVFWLLFAIAGTLHVVGF
jgi:hypothetical protein